MTIYNLEELKNNQPAVHARAEELSSQSRAAAQRSHYQNRARINSGDQHLLKDYDSIRDPTSGKQTYFCVETTVGEPPFYIGKTQIFLFEDEAEYDRSRTNWNLRSSF